MTSLAIVPMDERPVCTSLPVAVAAVAGVEALLPPAGCLPCRRRPGGLAALNAWISEQTETADTLVASLEGVGLGGLLPSRVGHEGVPEVLDRWSVLRTERAVVHASVVVPRAPDVDDATEEPAYWARHGRDVHALSAAFARAERGTRTDLDAARSAVPAEVRADWLARRLRQHTLALAATAMVQEGALATLMIGVDDAAPVSLSALDEEALAGWARRLELEDRVLVQPGTDESGAVLTARAVAAIVGVTPKIAVVCAVADGLDRTAPYETGPVGVTARRLVHAAGAVAVEDARDADAVLVVHPPDGTGDWASAPPASTDQATAASTAELTAGFRARAAAVGLADVAQPNGADPALITELSERIQLTELAAYAAWNTAGNSIGSAVAQLVAHVVGTRTGTFDRTAHEALLARRLVEDWAYMSNSRARARAALGADPTRHDHVESDHPVVTTVEAELGAALAAMPGFEDWRIVQGSTRFPWQRTFEIDLELERPA